MKRFLGLALSNLATLSMISLTFAPVSDVSAYSRNDCCEEECCVTSCDSNLWCWLGGALLGAAAGAGTGYAASQNGHRGHRGEIGPVGPVGPQGVPGPTGATGAPGTFAADVGQTLTFNPEFTVTDGIGGTVTPYVSFPDGTVLEGTPVVISALGDIVFPPFVITDPEFGEYNAGVQVSAVTITVEGTLVEIAVASRDGSSTLFADEIPAAFPLATEGQTSADFVYGPTNVP